MNDTAKLKMLLEHWIEHNAEHYAEFERWAARAGDRALDETADDISAAAEYTRQATDRLRAALARLQSGS